MIHKIIFNCQNKNIVIFVAVILYCSSALCQNKIAGYIFDANNNYPIPYATIKIIGVEKTIIANRTGLFTIDSTLLNCKLHFSSIGYNDTIVGVEYFKSSYILRLFPKQYSISELTVHPVKFKRIKLGVPFITLYNGSWHSIIGMIYPTFFPNNRRREGFIENFSVKIAANSRWDCPFKIRIMEVDTAYKTITFRTLHKDIEVKATKPGWCIIDLSSYQIPIPKNGFAVSIIIYDAGPSYYYRTSSNNKSDLYGIGVCQTIHSKEAIPCTFRGKYIQLKKFDSNYSYAVRATLKVIE
ncbi:hypothetical protein [Alistipes sp. ZOR0009]|uniref:hypothetical protein n=1 Tax=Alistipes sp. ZOR0009 TaxID=1339253 RepID=UPI0006468311|nr:hypothetical protein [Alistipes sp. ZOR0009]